MLESSQPQGLKIFFVLYDYGATISDNDVFTKQFLTQSDKIAQIFICWGCEINLFSALMISNAAREGLEFRALSLVRTCRLLFFLSVGIAFFCFIWGFSQGWKYFSTHGHFVHIT